MSDRIALIARLTLAEFRLRSHLPDLADRLRLAREDVETTTVERQPDESEETKDIQTMLKENGDLIITILKTLPSNSELRKKTKQTFDHVKGLQKTLNEIGKGLVDAIGGSDEELKDLDESAVGEIKSALDQQSKELGDLLKVSQLLKNFERKAAADVEHKPIKHKLPKKDKKEKDKAQIKTQDEGSKQKKPDRDLKQLLEGLE